MEKIYSVNTIKKWFEDKAKNEKKELSKNKLQALLYYVKGFYFMVGHEPLFNESIHIVNNLVTIDLIDQDLNESDIDNIEEKDSVVLNFVYEKIGKFEEEIIIKNLLQELDLVGFKCGYLPDDFISEIFTELYNKNFGKYPNNYGLNESDIIMLTSSFILYKYKVAFTELAKY